MILILFVVALVIFGTVRVGRRLAPRQRLVLFLASGVMASASHYVRRLTRFLLSRVFRARVSAMIISGEYTLMRTCASKSAAAWTTLGSKTHSPERRANPAWMPMSISFEAAVHTVRACDDKPRTNFANRRMASFGLLGCGDREVEASICDRASQYVYL
jgi:hypothetical protein